MVVNPPELPDIHLVLEQLDSAVEHVPDWLLQGLAVWAASKGIEWTWKHRQAIAQRLRKPRHIRVTVTDGIGITDNVQPVLLSGSIGAKATLTGELTVSRPSLAERLADEGIELLSWYFRQA